VFQALIISVYLLSTDEIDVIHAFDYALAGSVGAILRALFPVTFVLSVRGLKEPIYQERASERSTLRSRLSYRILIRLTGTAIRRADHIVTKAPYQVRFLRERYNPTAGFSTIPTGVDFNTFDPSRTFEGNVLFEILEKAGADITTDTKVILFLGKLVEEKGPHRLLNLIDEMDTECHSDLRFALVGPARDEEYAQELLRRCDPDTTVVYPHRVPFDRVPALLDAATAVTQFSRPNVEGTPRVLQESCAMCTPIIASNVTGISDVFSGLPGCFLVDPDDAEAFASAVHDVLDGDVAMSRDVFREVFDIDTNYAEYAEIYNSLISGRSPRVDSLLIRDGE